MDEGLHAARQEELIHFGAPPSFDIRMFPQLDDDLPFHCNVIHASTRHLRDVVEEIGKQFRREGGFDFQPFRADDPTSDGVLFNSRRFTATFAIAAGAAGFTQTDDTWSMDWVWLHPYERRYGRLDGAWDELELRYGQFHIDGPVRACDDGVHPEPWCQLGPAQQPAEVAGWRLLPLPHRPHYHVRWLVSHAEQLLIHPNGAIHFEIGSTRPALSNMSGSGPSSGAAGPGGRRSGQVNAALLPIW
jgi:hypothetical protein